MYIALTPNNSGPVSAGPLSCCIVQTSLPVWPMGHAQRINDCITLSAIRDQSDVELAVCHWHEEGVIIGRQAADFQGDIVLV